MGVIEGRREGGAPMRLFLRAPAPPTVQQEGAAAQVLRLRQRRSS